MFRHFHPIVGTRHHILRPRARTPIGRPGSRRRATQRAGGAPGLPRRLRPFARAGAGNAARRAAGRDALATGPRSPSTWRPSAACVAAELIGEALLRLRSTRSPTSTATTAMRRGSGASTHGAARWVSSLRGPPPCSAGRRFFGIRRPVTCPFQLKVGRQLPLQRNVMVCFRHQSSTISASSV